MSVILALIAGADAAEVVWLAPPEAGQAEQVGAAAGASRGPLALIDLRAAATDWTDADAKAYEALGATLKDVRKYETQLDGELLIMDELAGPIGKIGIVRNDDDRTALFSALAYQGFAVDRFFGDQLGKDARAEKHRVEYEGLNVPRPWADGVALDPDREVTPYDIAEAPQRVAYSKVQALVKRQLPGRLVPTDIPANVALYADGRPLAISASGSASLVPGRHLVHATLDGHVIARWDVRVNAGEKVEAVLPVKEADLTAFVDGLPAKTAPPAALGASIHALGDEVWIADPRGGLKVYKVRADAVETVDVGKMKPPGGTDTDDKGLSFGVSVAPGWVSTGDFVLQDPDNVPATKGAVNAMALSLGASADIDAGPLRFGAGIDAAFTLGQYHVANYGESSTRFRTYPYAEIGVPLAQVTLGWAFPHHPTAGLKASIPVSDAVEIRGFGWYGLGLNRERTAGATFEGSALYALSVGATYRVR